VAVPHDLRGCAEKGSSDQRRAVRIGLTAPSWAAAAAKAGAIWRHGPHHSAQKSTSSGIPLLFRWASKLRAPKVTGWPSNSALPQRPHLPPAVSLSYGTRFAVERAGQMIRTGSDVFISRPFGGEEPIRPPDYTVRTRHEKRRLRLDPSDYKTGPVLRREC